MKEEAQTGKTAAMPSVQSFNTMKARSYVMRLPLFTRAMILIMSTFWIVGVQSVWDVREWGALTPDKVTFATGSSNTKT